MDEQQRKQRAGLIEAHRLDGFFDAAFAFAVSILAIAGTEMPRDFHEMLLALNRIPAFACSFATMLVFFALIFVYPLNMMFSAMFNAVYNGFTGRLLPDALVIEQAHDMTLLYLCYGSAYACMAGCLALLYRHSLRHMHDASGEEVIEARESFYIQVGSMGVALLSVLVALVAPDGGWWSAIPGCIYFLLTFVYSLTGRWARRMLAAEA